MLEKKLKEVKTKIMVAGITTMLAACGGGTCMEPEYGIKQKAEISAANTYVLGPAQQQGSYATASCRSGCTYNSDSDCCWCPD